MPALRDGDRQTSGACWPSSLASLASSRSAKYPVFKTRQTALEHWQAKLSSGPHTHSHRDVLQHGHEHAHIHTKILVYAVGSGPARYH